MGEAVAANDARCPVCAYANSMPMECLRETFEDLECGRCGEALQYCGRLIGGGDFEIVTRTLPPRRVQLRRTKGWRMPENTVKVDRTTKWGNPYKEGITPGNYASWFREDVTKEMASERPTEDHPWSRHLHFIGQNLHILRGHNLACWCPLDQPCHADVLLELANASPKATAAGGKGA